MAGLVASCGLLRSPTALRKKTKPAEAKGHGSRSATKWAAMVRARKAGVVSGKTGL